MVTTMKLPEKRLEKICAYIAAALLAVSLIPIMALGFYNHALGDDFYYGLDAKLALNSGTIIDAVIAAFKGTVYQYRVWQGTYSAMFLMHIPPQIFGDFFYKLYPAVLLTVFTAGFFYLLKPILCHYLKTDIHCYITVCSVTVFLCIQQVPTMGEAFYWYNGSMYYTGFFAATLFFFGFMVRFLISGRKKYVILSSVLGFFLAGGNYTSLLPSLIIIFLIILFGIIRKNPVRKTLGVAIPFTITLAGFAISIAAPGNKLRQATSYGTTPLKAVLKSLRQGTSYLMFWSSTLLFICLMLLTPIFIKIIRNINYKFRYPLLVLFVAFGIFSSASCPTFYAQNNGGAARVFDLSWYMLVILIISGYFYTLGWFIKKFDKKTLIVSEAVLMTVLLLLLIFRPAANTNTAFNCVTTFRAIASGDAAYYRRQYEERLTLLDSDEKNIEFQSYDVPQSLLYVLYLGDLSSDASDFNNVYFAVFYGKDSVRTYSAE